MWKTEQTSNVGYMLLNLIAFDVLLWNFVFVQKRIIQRTNVWWVSIYGRLNCLHFLMFCKPQYM